MTYLSRYLAGEHETVWAELTALGPAERDEPVWSDARAVARETMTRVRRNAEQLIASLRELGYEFRPETWMPQPLLTPRLADLALIDELEDRVGGPLPLSVRAFYENVGPISLRGRHPQWELEYPDELILDPLIDLHERLILRSEYDPSLTGFELDLAPDYLHKADVSGGAPYAIALPNPAADIPFENERHGTTFVDYLRIAFRHGGFPGLDLTETEPAQPWLAGSIPANDLEHLTRNLLPF
jgi:hypothetical protein